MHVVQSGHATFAHLCHVCSLPFEVDNTALRPTILSNPVRYSPTMRFCGVFPAWRWRQVGIRDSLLHLELGVRVEQLFNTAQVPEQPLLDAL